MAEDEDDKVLCAKCDKDITEDVEDKGTAQYTCKECNDVFCTDCCVQFDYLTAIICKGCIDKVYPREKEVVEKVVEKVIEVPKEVIKVMGFSEPIL